MHDDVKACMLPERNMSNVLILRSQRWPICLKQTTWEDVFYLHKDLGHTRDPNHMCIVVTMMGWDTHSQRLVERLLQQFLQCVLHRCH